MSKGPIELLAEGSASAAIISMAHMIELKLNILAREHERMNEQIYDLEALLANTVSAHQALEQTVYKLGKRECKCLDPKIQVPEVQDDVRSPDPSTKVPKQTGKKTKQAGKSTC